MQYILHLIKICKSTASYILSVLLSSHLSCDLKAPLANCLSCSDWLSVWCIAFYVDFGHVRIPRNLNVPPSLRMLGIEPQSKLNCEVLDENIGYEVRWAIAGKSIVTQLVARLGEEQYMAFGLSGEQDRSR